MRRQVLALATLMLLAGALANGQHGPQDKRMWFYVVDVGTFDGIEGAAVTITYGNSSFTGTTDRHGRLIVRVPLGTWTFTVEATAPGYNPGEVTQTVSVAKNGVPQMSLALQPTAAQSRPSAPSHSALSPLTRPTPRPPRPAP